VMQRISVVGNSGSGKSTLAQALADRLGLPLLELDALRHQADWEELPDDEFVARTKAFVAGDGWVVDGNYRVVRETTVWPTADTVVWLDFSRPVVMRQLVGRTARRTVTREELWNGNRERIGSALSWDPSKSVIRWAWTQHDNYVRLYSEARNDPRWAHLRFVRLTSRREIAELLASTGD
jgi:adenylate kinase family enzyme